MAISPKGRGLGQRRDYDPAIGEAYPGGEPIGKYDCHRQWVLAATTKQGIFFAWYWTFAGLVLRLWRKGCPNWGEFVGASDGSLLPELPQPFCKSSFVEEEDNRIINMRATIGNDSSSIVPEFLSALSVASDVEWSLWVEWFRSGLVSLRTMVLAPLLRVMVFLCMVMSVLLVIEKLFMGAVSLYVRLTNRKPERVYKWEPMSGDEESENLDYPMVLVQVPMYNEKEVYQLSIGAACNLSWPANRLVIQVLDDSTDPTVKELVKKECEKWAEKGRNIRYETRSNRNGYKAGALDVGMKYPYVSKCDHVAIFDADFQPEPDFLLRMVPFLIHNSEIALVQARWKFVNADECMMTRIQEMSMDYHFKVEQESGSSSHAFFGFNGTAGVWRICALNGAGGWNHRTTVEDMDLAVRAGLSGWKFVYVGDIKVKSELPSTFKAYRNQQHRWSTGPAYLFKKMLFEIVRNSKVTVWRKFYVIYNFFIARRIIAHIVTFLFYCVVIPMSCFIPEVKVSNWGVIYIPTTITLLNAVGTPSSFHLVPFWVLFENVMAMHRSKAVLIGLFEAGSVNEWIVTGKLGDSLKKEVDKPLLKKTKIFEGLNILEIFMSIFLLACASYDCLYRHDNYFIYIFPQSITFFLMGIGYVGTFVPDAK